MNGTDCEYSRFQIRSEQQNCQYFCLPIVVCFDKSSSVWDWDQSSTVWSVTSSRYRKSTRLTCPLGASVSNITILMWHEEARTRGEIYLTKRAIVAIAFCQFLGPCWPVLLENFADRRCHRAKLGTNGRNTSRNPRTNFILVTVVVCFKWRTPADVG